MWRPLTASLVAATVVSMTDGAFACSCDYPKNARSHNELQAWKLGQAENVVSGRVTEVWGGEHNGRRALFAKMVVSSVVKGSVTGPEVTLVSSLNEASCGAPSVLLDGFGQSADVAVELFKSAADENQYQISYCGYANSAAVTRQPAR